MYVCVCVCEREREGAHVCTCMSTCTCGVCMPICGPTNWGEGKIGIRGTIRTFAKNQSVHPIPWSRPREEH